MALYAPAHERRGHPVGPHIHEFQAPGIARTQWLVENKFCQEGLKSDVAQFVKACPLFAQTHTPWHLPSRLFEPLTMLQNSWSQIGLDLITDLASSQGHTVILTIVDWFSKACHLIPLTKLPTTLQILFKEVLHHYGLPEDIIQIEGFSSVMFMFRVQSVASFLQMAE